MRSTAAPSSPASPTLPPEDATASAVAPARIPASMRWIPRSPTTSYIGAATARCGRCCSRFARYPPPPPPTRRKCSQSPARVSAAAGKASLASAAPSEKRASSDSSTTTEPATSSIPRPSPKAKRPAIRPASSTSPRSSFRCPRDRSSAAPPRPFRAKRSSPPAVGNPHYQTPIMEHGAISVLFSLRSNK